MTQRGWRIGTTRPARQPLAARVIGGGDAMPGASTGESGLRLAELVAALSLATDLTIGVPTEHALRSAILAVRLGDILGASETERHQSYYLALLRYVGCTSSSHADAQVFGDEIAVGTWTAGVDLADPPE